MKRIQARAAWGEMAGNWPAVLSFDIPMLHNFRFDLFTLAEGFDSARGIFVATHQEIAGQQRGLDFWHGWVCKPSSLRINLIASSVMRAWVWSALTVSANGSIMMPSAGMPFSSVITPMIEALYCLVSGKTTCHKRMIGTNNLSLIFKREFGIHIFWSRLSQLLQDKTLKFMKQVGEQREWH